MHSRLAARAFSATVLLTTARTAQAQVDLGLPAMMPPGPGWPVESYEEMLFKVLLFVVLPLGLLTLASTIVLLMKRMRKLNSGNARAMVAAASGGLLIAIVFLLIVNPVVLRPVALVGIADMLRYNSCWPGACGPFGIEWTPLFAYSGLCYLGVATFAIRDAVGSRRNKNDIPGPPNPPGNPPK